MSLLAAAASTTSPMNTIGLLLNCPDGEVQGAACPVKYLTGGSDPGRAKWPDFIQPWIDKVSRINDDSLSLPVQLIPEECISSESRGFVFELIKRTKYFLTETRI
jgi:hypothetical protein